MTSGFHDCGYGHTIRRNGWMALLTQWTRVWTNSGRWCRTGKPVILQSIGSKRVGHNLVTEQQQQWPCCLLRLGELREDTVVGGGEVKHFSLDTDDFLVCIRFTRPKFFLVSIFTRLSSTPSDSRKAGFTFFSRAGRMALRVSSSLLVDG